MNIVKSTYQSDEDEGAASEYSARTESAATIAKEVMSGSNIVTVPSSTLESVVGVNALDLINDGSEDDPDWVKPDVGEIFVGEKGVDWVEDFSTRLGPRTYGKLVQRDRVRPPEVGTMKSAAKLFLELALRPGGVDVIQDRFGFRVLSRPKPDDPSAAGSHTERYIFFDVIQNVLMTCCCRESSEHVSRLVDLERERLLRQSACLRKPSDLAAPVFGSGPICSAPSRATPVYEVWRAEQVRPIGRGRNNTIRSVQPVPDLQRFDAIAFAASLTEKLEGLDRAFQSKLRIVSEGGKETFNRWEREIRPISTKFSGLRRYISHNDGWKASVAPLKRDLARALVSIFPDSDRLLPRFDWFRGAMLDSALRAGGAVTIRSFEDGTVLSESAVAGSSSVTRLVEARPTTATPVSTSVTQLMTAAPACPVEAEIDSMTMENMDPDGVEEDETEEVRSVVRQDSSVLREQRALAGLAPGWEKMLKAVDRYYLTGGREEYVTVEELTAYCSTMSYDTGGSSDHAELVRLILENLDRALAGGGEGRRPRETSKRRPTVPEDSLVVHARRKRAKGVRSPSGSETISEPERSPEDAAGDTGAPHVRRERASSSAEFLARRTGGGLPVLDPSGEDADAVVKAAGAPAVVSAMRDRERLDVAVAGTDISLPNLLLSWLWFRRHILSVPVRCLNGWARGHCISNVPPDLPSPLADAEYPFLLRGLGPSDPLVSEFEEQISLFRRLVLKSSDVELSRYSGALSGELGLRTRRQLAYPRVRAAIPGFVTEIVDDDVWARLEAAEYSSLLVDGRRRFILYGPLALVMDGRDDVWFGPVSSYIQWESYDPATKSFGRGDKEEGVRQIFLGGVPKSGEARKKPRAAFGAGDEIVVPYSGMRKVSHFPAAVPDRGDGEELAVLTAELDQGNVEISVARDLGRLGESRTSATAPSGNSTRK